MGSCPARQTKRNSDAILFYFAHVADLFEKRSEFDKRVFQQEGFGKGYVLRLVGKVMFGMSWEFVAQRSIRFLVWIRRWALGPA